MAAEEAAAVWPNSGGLPGIDRLCRERVQFTDLYCHPDVDKQPRDANIVRNLLVLQTSKVCASRKEPKRRGLRNTLLPSTKFSQSGPFKVASCPPM